MNQLRVNVEPLNKEANDNYLKQESCKVFDAAFEAFYRLFPNGMLAHFTANLAILEAIPHDAGVLHIVDFDMGEGIQWASMIVALAQQQKLLQQFAHPHLRFEETKKQLICYANCHDLKLKVEEMELQDLVSEIKKTTRGRRREWPAFNCMWALPHMRRRRRRRHVIEFLNVAKDFLANSDKKWKEVKEVYEFEAGFGLKGVRLSSESLMEAKVMAREGESLYTVRIEGENANEMVLEWGRTPLVRVSAWR
ncbi:hypothetical protein Pint_34924 [Pistacia integerrima]|uniref:Uncharacterized protein n=1 Tax=Pistacia integerrima TaxID=434235 RepID=A0ACC0Y2A7_9ROSI|nr:hypothetical protein Pint_34924 [Pistacia integerrima]